MRALPMFVVVLLALVLASFGCQPGTGGGGDNGAPTILGALAVDATPRTIVPGGTSMGTVIASDPDAGDTLTYSWAIDAATKGTIVAGATPGTAIFTAAADAAEGTVATLTVTVDDGNGHTATASVDVTISQEAGFAVPEGTASGYVGADTCARCHSRTHDRWATSAHALATYTDARPGGSGFDAAWTNVECEDCHGPGHDHATSPGQRSTADVPWDVIDVPDHTVCQPCHSAGTSAPAAYTDWAGVPGANEGDPAIQEPSAHANSMEPMSDRDASCLDCHSVDRIDLWQDVVAPVTAATLVNDPITAENPVTCLVCHSPHRATTRDTNTDDAFGTGSICLECHSSVNAAPGWDASRDAPLQPRYNPAGDFIQTTKGFAEDGNELPGDPSPHLAAMDAEGNANLCVVCHAYASATSTGHTFLFRADDPPPASGCACHPGGLPEGLRSEIGARLTALQPYIPGRSAWGASFSRDQYDALSDADKTRFQIAVWDYALVNRDASRGAHNPDYAKAVLDVAEGIINDLTGSTL